MRVLKIRVKNTSKNKRAIENFLARLYSQVFRALIDVSNVFALLHLVILVTMWRHLII